MMRHPRLLLLGLLASVLAEAAPPSPAPAPTAVGTALPAAASTATAKPGTASKPTPQLTASPDDSQLITLTLPEGPSPALLRAAKTPTTVGAVILLPAGGRHPDWAGAIQALRRELPKWGWLTLSLTPADPPVPLAPYQLPSQAELDRRDNNALARVNAALARLKQENIRNIVLLGQGENASALARLHTLKPFPDVTALILLAPPPEPATNDSLAETLGKLKLPTLEVLAAEQDPELLGRHRSAAFKAQIPWRALLLHDQAPDFPLLEAETVKRVRGWLKRVEGSEVRAPRAK